MKRMLLLIVKCGYPPGAQEVSWRKEFFAPDSDRYQWSFIELPKSPE